MNLDVRRLQGMTSKPMTYTAGPCSVCAFAGDALFAACAATGRIFYLCPGCGCAWLTVPEACVVDTINQPSEFAPSGIRLPTREDIRRAGLEHLIQDVYPDDMDCRLDDWRPRD